MTTTITDDLRRHALELATLREEAAQRDAEVKAARQAFELTIADQAKNAEATKRLVEAKESEVRALALVAHEQTQSTKPCGGVSIITLTEYDIDDAAVISYAEQSDELRDALLVQSLDMKRLKRLAAVLPIPGVTVKHVHAVRIASDLLSALSETTQEVAA